MKVMRVSVVAALLAAFLVSGCSQVQVCPHCGMDVHKAPVKSHDGGGKTHSPTAETNPADSVDDNVIEILRITDITAQVPTHGGGQKKVRFDLNIQFGGNQEERTRSMEWVMQKDRESFLVQLANEVMTSYDFLVISDSAFPQTFETAFRDRFNSLVKGHKIREAKIYNQDW